MEPRVPRVSDRHLAERRQHILDAAVRCFARYGFHDATLARICDEAGVSRGAVYHYFGSKEEIITALRERSQRDYGPLWRILQAERPVRERLAGFLRAALEQMAEPGSDEANRLGILLWAESLLNPQILAGQINSISPIHELIEHAIRDAQASGEIDPALEPHYVSCIVLAVLLGFQMQCGWDPTLEPAKAAAVIDSLLANALAPPVAGPPG